MACNSRQYSEGVGWNCNNWKDCEHCFNLRRKHWLGRIAAEAYMADHVRFVTLTYDPENLDAKALSLHGEHMKDYNKVRRRKYRFKHMTVGERGEKNQRPHWHSIQFYYGKGPEDVLNFSTKCYGWAKGNSKYEVPRSIAGSASYLYDYLDKGGVMLRPSPGIGKQYLLNFARMQARNGLPLTKKGQISYTVPNARKKSGELWWYQFPTSHHWAPEIASHYIDEWELTRSEQLDWQSLSGINYDSYQ